MSLAAKVLEAKEKQRQSIGFLHFQGTILEKK